MKNNFRKYREAMGLRQQDVALELGLSRAAYAHYEKGIREPKQEMLIKLADLFYTSIDDLLGHKCLQRPEQMQRDVPAASAGGTPAGA